MKGQEEVWCQEGRGGSYNHRKEHLRNKDPQKRCTAHLRHFQKPSGSRPIPKLLPNPVSPQYLLLSNSGRRQLTQKMAGRKYNTEHGRSRVKNGQEARYWISTRSAGFYFVELIVLKCWVSFLCTIGGIICVYIHLLHLEPYSHPQPLQVIRAPS